MFPTYRGVLCKGRFGKRELAGGAEGSFVKRQSLEEAEMKKERIRTVVRLGHRGVQKTSRCGPEEVFTEGIRGRDQEARFVFSTGDPTAGRPGKGPTDGPSA